MTSVAHLDVADIAADDVVAGTLPVSLAAQVCAAGAEYWHLTLDLPPHLRGIELTAAQMVETGAHVERYTVCPFQQLHRRRTAGDPVLPLTNYGGTGREDNYVVGYFGREYDSDHFKHRPALEVVTSAFQLLFPLRRAERPDRPRRLPARRPGDGRSGHRHALPIRSADGRHAMTVHTIRLPNMRYGRELRTILWDDEAAIVEGDHSKIPWMRERIAAAPTELVNEDLHNPPEGPGPRPARVLAPAHRCLLSGRPRAVALDHARHPARRRAERTGDTPKSHASGLPAWGGGVSADLDLGRETAATLSITPAAPSRSPRPSTPIEGDHGAPGTAGSPLSASSDPPRQSASRNRPENPPIPGPENTSISRRFQTPENAPKSTVYSPKPPCERSDPSLFLAAPIRPVQQR